MTRKSRRRLYPRRAFGCERAEWFARDAAVYEIMDENDGL